MPKKIILIGCGGVGKTFLEMMIVAKFHPTGFAKHVIILEPRDLSDEPTIHDLRSHNYVVDVVQVEVVKSNVNKLLDKYVSTGDIVLDVSYNVAFQPLINHCSKVEAHYINTSLERWEMKDEDDLNSDYQERVLHTMHVKVKELCKAAKTKSTIVVTHGMNPGLITHFTCTALTKLAHFILKTAKKRKISNLHVNLLNVAYKNRNYALMGYLMSLRTVHCSERDTQVSKVKREKNTFMNTWGPYSFYSEGVDPVQLGWGTHEDEKLTPFARRKIKVVLPTYGEKNQIFPHIRGVDLMLKSYVPVVNKDGELTNKPGEIIGMAISHSENDTANQYLSLYNEGQLIYRPSNYYVYSPCKDAWDSLAEVKKSKYNMLKNQFALRGHDIASGEDAVGSLLVFSCDPVQKILHDKIDTGTTSFWSGTILNISQAKKLGFKHAGPTTIQVGISLINAIKWMLANPKQGLCFPEDLPHEKIIADSAKYLGTVFMDFVPYSPKAADIDAFIK